MREVLVAVAGPVGLTMASEPARHAVTCRIIRLALGDPVGLAHAVRHRQRPGRRLGR